ncbi:uncharacterized protein LOC121111175 isoform X9 [Gallus gallus]|uniref:uncharacterized protein LOC121111175 isoform X9 n=1 Tax=Gallus gallus TaxID=9031 RepID=UPI001F0061EE|nr:uncharacterized protein LOC121111175 isoform X9 [Gallus gallus]
MFDNLPAFKGLWFWPLLAEQPRVANFCLFKEFLLDVTCSCSGLIIPALCRKKKEQWKSHSHSARQTIDVALVWANGLPELLWSSDGARATSEVPCTSWPPVVGRRLPNGFYIKRPLLILSAADKEKVTYKAFPDLRSQLKYKKRAAEYSRGIHPLFISLDLNAHPLSTGFIKTDHYQLCSAASGEK